MDSSKYVNTYLDFAIGMIHEGINERLQLKTQIKLSNDLVAERDQVISALKTEIENLKKQSTEEINLQNDLNEEKRKSKQWEDSYHALNNKVSHFDNLTNQFNDIKSQLITKNNELNAKNNELEKFKKLNQELSKNINDLTNDMNTLKTVNEEFVKKIAILETPKKQINTTSRKKAAPVQSLPILQESVSEVKKVMTDSKQIENNDF